MVIIITVTFALVLCISHLKGQTKLEIRTEFPMALYDVIAAVVVIIVAIPKETVFILYDMAITCGGQVALDMWLLCR
jgi:hypothetical protein